VSLREEHNLLGARITNSRKSLQRFFRFGERLLEHTVEIAIELLQRDLRDAAKLVHSRGRTHSAKPGDFEQSLVVSHQNFGRRQTGSFSKRIKGLLPAFVTHQVSDVFEENHA